MHSTDTTTQAATTQKIVVDADALRAALDHLIGLAGTQARAAERLGISPQYLHDVLHGRRDIDALAERMGYRSLTLYLPDGSPGISPALAARVIEKLRRTRIEIGGAA